MYSARSTASYVASEFLILCSRLRIHLRVDSRRAFPDVLGGILRTPLFQQREYRVIATRISGEKLERQAARHVRVASGHQIRHVIRAGEEAIHPVQVERVRGVPVMAQVVGHVTADT